jgi:hypothetical protein
MRLEALYPRIQDGWQWDLQLRTEALYENVPVNDVNLILFPQGPHSSGYGDP